MFSILLIIVCVLLLLVYLVGKYNETYWRRRNVTFYTKNKVMGVFWDYLTTDKSFFETFRGIYETYRNEPAVGIGSLWTPALYIVNTKNLQHVLSSDFKSFNHRGIEVNKGDLLADNILFMNGNRWKLVRQNMTPLFTSSKLKSMYYIIDKSATDFVDQVQNNPELCKGNMYETLSRFCSAAVGAAVFGVGTKSIFDSPFLHMAQETLKTNFFKDLKFAVSNFSDTLFKALNLKLFSEHEKFFIGSLKQILKERELQNTKKHDFADMCFALKKAGNMVDKTTGLEIEPTDELLAAQAFFFFVAGVEPTASAIFSTLVELGRNPEHLETLHKEIDDAFKNNNNKLSFDIIANMKFLDMAISEALRMYPPIGFLTRQCVQDTVLPVGNIKVDKGTKIFTPIFEIHYDERFYPEPEIYKPERFAPENRHAISDATYMPFGGGNRICVGMRYAMLQAKAGLVHVLHNFTAKTIIHDGGIKFSKEQVQVRLSNVDVQLIPRKHVEN